MSALLPSLLTTETLLRYQICPRREGKKQEEEEDEEKKKGKERYSLLLTCFYYLTGKKKLFDICGQKNKLLGSGHSGVSD